MATPIKTRKTRFLMLVDDGTGTAAEIVDFGELVTTVTTPEVSVSTVDVTSFDDDVDVLLQTGSDPGAFSFGLLDPDNLPAQTKLADLLRNRGRRATLLIGQPNGTFTAPSLPTNTAGVLGWTLPVGPYAYGFRVCDVEIQEASMGLTNKDVFRETLTCKALTRLLRYNKGASAPI